MFGPQGMISSIKVKKMLGTSSPINIGKDDGLEQGHNTWRCVGNRQNEDLRQCDGINMKKGKLKLIMIEWQKNWKEGKN